MDFLKYEKLIASSLSKLKQAEQDYKDLGLKPIDGWMQLVAPYIVSGLTLKDLMLITTEQLHNKNAAEFDLFAKPSKITQIDGGTDRIIDSYLKDLEYSLSNGLSMILFGFNGAGKTHTAKFLLYEAIRQNYSGFYINSAEMQRLHNKVNFSGDSDLNSECVYAHMLQCNLLVIDEVGKESLTDNFLIAFESILKSRASKDKSTIMVTNLNFDNDGKNEFFARYGSSIYNLLFEHYRVILLSAKGEFRKKSRKVWK